MQISASAQNAMCTALVHLVDVGGGPGYIQFRTGAPPATPQAANTGTLLASHVFNNPAFTEAGPAGLQPDGEAKMLVTGVSDTIVADGVVGHWRIFAWNNVCVMQGEAGPDTAFPDFELGAEDIELNNTTFETGGEITIQSLVVFVPPE